DRGRIADQQTPRRPMRVCRALRAGDLNSTGPWSPKPARIWANPRVRREFRRRQEPHIHAVSGGSLDLFGLAENRGVAGSILALAISRGVLHEKQVSWPS